MRFGAISIVVLVSGVVRGGSPLEGAARELYQRTEYRQSLALLGRIATKNAPVLGLMGQDYFMLGEFKKASETFEKAVALDPNNPRLLHWMGRCYGRRAEMANPFTAPGLASKARQMFEKSIALDPSNRDVVGDLLDFYLQAPGILGGGMKKAEDLAALIGRSDAAEGHSAQAIVDQKRKQYDAAERNLRSALALAPRQVGRLLDLAMFLAQRGRIGESDAIFDQAFRMAPENPRILFHRADTYIQQQRNLNQARDLLKRYLQAPLTPDDPPRERAQALLKKIGA